MLKAQESISDKYHMHMMNVLTSSLLSLKILRDFSHHVHVCSTFW